MNNCIKCMLQCSHPFHDNGKINTYADTSEWSGIDWHREEKANMKERQRITLRNMIDDIDGVTFHVT